MSEQQKMDQERAAFEAAYSSIHGSISAGELRDLRRGDDYAESTADRLNYSWRIWQARASLPVGVPDGWALVPKRMSLSPADIAAIMFQCGGDEEAEEFEDRFNGGVLWVGETLDDDGSKSYGLNIACVECLEEGSTPVVEFSPPAMLAAAPAAQPAAEQSQRALIRHAMNLLNLRSHVPGSDVDICVQDLRKLLDGQPITTPPPSEAWREVAEIAEQSAPGEVGYPDFRPELASLVQACQRFVEADGSEVFPEDVLAKAEWALANDAHAASVRYAARDAGEVSVPVELLQRCASRLHNMMQADLEAELRALLAQRERGGE